MSLKVKFFKNKNLLLKTQYLLSSTEVTDP